MGTPKGLLDYHGRPWIVAQLAALPPARVVVVLGHDAAAYREVLEGAEVTIAVNPAPERGAFSSLQVGLEAAGKGAAFVLPLDVPAPNASVWERLEATASSALPVWEQKGGHPVRVSEELARRLCRLDPSDPAARLDTQLRMDGALRVPVEDVRVTMNLNTPEAWRRFVENQDPE